MTIIYFIFLQIGNKIIQIRLAINHNWMAVSKISINLPASHGIVKALIPKHWEYKAIAVPWNLIGEDFIIWFEADGRNMHRAIVIGIKAISINKYPSFEKLETVKKIKPITRENKHNLNLNGELLFLKI